MGHRTIAAVMLACLLGRARAQAPETFQLSGRVLGASGKNAVYVALWDAEGYLEKPLEQIRIDPGAEPVFSFRISGTDAAASQRALSAFEDRNGNGVLDMGMFGPKEPSGFWRPFTGRRKPKFDEVAARIDRDIADANITLR